jgi:pyruvate-ferredoxin/flavodoxin oxidoreductase
VQTFAASEARFAILSRTDPARAEHLLALAQADIDERWRYYQQLAAIERKVPAEAGVGSDVNGAAGQAHDKEAV